MQAETRQQTWHSQQMDGAQHWSPFFTCAQINSHIASSRKNKTAITTRCWQDYGKPKRFWRTSIYMTFKLPMMRDFYCCTKCFHSFKVREHPHNLKLVLSVFLPRSQICILWTHQYRRKVRNLQDKETMTRSFSTKGIRISCYGTWQKIWASRFNRVWKIHVKNRKACQSYQEWSLCFT